MSKLGSWSTTPGLNTATPPDGWPEGQAPSTVNDCAREMMASIRATFNDAQYFDANNTPSFLTATTFSLGTADVANFHVGRRVKLYDTTTLYGTINSVSATFVSVRLDSGQLTTSLSSCALAILSDQNSSLPTSTWRRNIIINGGMDVWQRGSGFVANDTTNQFTADRFLYIQSATAKCNITRSTSRPSVHQAGIYIHHSLLLSVSAADSTLGTTEFSLISYRIEGYDWRQIAHKPTVLSFWCFTNTVGIYHVAVRNSPVTHSYVQPFTVSTGTANAWNRFAIQVPATEGINFNYNHSLGAEISWCFGSGSGLQGGTGNWTAVDIIAGPGQTNMLANAGNTFFITGIQFEEGTRPTQIEQVHYSETLARCQRYYWRGLPAMAFNFPSYTANTVMSWPIKFPASMRDVPTLQVSFSGITEQNLKGNPSVSQPTIDGCRLIASASLASTNTNFTFATTDWIAASSEL